MGNKKSTLTNKLKKYVFRDNNKPNVKLHKAKKICNGLQKYYASLGASYDNIFYNFCESEGYLDKEALEDELEEDATNCALVDFHKVGNDESTFPFHWKFRKRDADCRQEHIYKIIKICASDCDISFLNGQIIINKYVDTSQKDKKIVHAYINQITTMHIIKEIQDLIFIYFHEIIDTQILTGTELNKLCDMLHNYTNERFLGLMENKSFQLIHRCTMENVNYENHDKYVYIMDRDKLSNMSQNCQNKRDLFMIIKGRWDDHTEVVIGGYTEIGWSKLHDDGVTDNNSFLFMIRHPCPKHGKPRISHIKKDRKPPSLYHLNKTQYISSNLIYCPFGNTLYINDDCNGNIMVRISYSHPNDLDYDRFVHKYMSLELQECEIFQLT